MTARWHPSIVVEGKWVYQNITSKICSYCNVQTQNGSSFLPDASTMQHIIPRRLYVYRPDADNSENMRNCCRECNATLDQVNDCPAALTCAIAVADKLKISVRITIKTQFKFSTVRNHEKITVSKFPYKDTIYSDRKKVKPKFEVASNTPPYKNTYIPNRIFNW